MQIIRTIVWVVLFIALLLFSLNNWEQVDVKIWEGLIFETKKPVLVIAAFLLGLVPMWLLHKAGRWRMTRRINSLENTVRATSTPATPAPAPIAATTPLEANPTEPPAA